MKRRNPSLAWAALGAIAIGGYLWYRNRRAGVLYANPWPNTATPITSFVCPQPYNCYPVS